MSEELINNSNTNITEPENLAAQPNVFETVIFDVETFSTLLKETIGSIRNTELESLEMFNIIKQKIQEAPKDIQADLMLMLGEQAKGFLELASQQPDNRVKALQVAANLVKQNQQVQITNTVNTMNVRPIAEKLNEIDPLAESYKNDLTKTKIETTEQLLLLNNDDSEEAKITVVHSPDYNK